MNVKISIGLVLLCILIMNGWKSTVVEGMVGLDPIHSSPAGYVPVHSSVDHSPPKPSDPIKKSKPLGYKKEIEPMCEGGFVLPGFPYTMQ